MSGPATIVHVLGWRSQQYGSFERYLVALAARCDERGAQTRVVLPAPPASASFAADLRARLHVIPAARAPGDPLFAGRLARMLHGVRATHLHVHFGADAYTALAVGRALRVPRRFATKHITPGPRCGRHRWLARQVDVVFAVSRWVADGLIACGVRAAKVEVAYLGVDAASYSRTPAGRARVRAELGLAESTRLVLSTSHLRPGKGVERLPELAAALGRDPGETTVVLAGTGPLRAELEARAAELRLGADRFRLLGVREDVPDLLSAADLFVFPTGADHAEGMPMGGVEAVASGVPSVLTDVTDNRLLADGAAVVPAGDFDAMLAAARRLLADPEAAAALAERGRRLVEERFAVGPGVETHLRRYELDGGTTTRR